MDAMMTGDGLTVFVGLTPYQQECVVTEETIFPDNHSRRFGLRTTCRAAIERAHYFMEWSPEGPKGEVKMEEVTPYKIKFTPFGYMQMVETGKLVYTKPGEYRWRDVLRTQLYDDVRRLIYEITAVDYITLK